VRSQNFKRIAIVAKNSGRAVSEILDIEDSYESFCIDEAAYYVYAQLAKPESEDGKKLLSKMAVRKKK
jgi:hypothetical protein